MRIKTIKGTDGTRTKNKILKTFEGAKLYIDPALQNIIVRDKILNFVTHLLENGIDSRYIQELLGHKSSKTTKIYTLVSNKDFIRIKNPLDQIFQAGEK